MTTNEAMRLIWIVLFGIPAVAVAMAVGWAWYTCSSVKEPVAARDYHTNHVNRKGY